MRNRILSIVAAFITVTICQAQISVSVNNTASEENIIFADSEVKSICIANWDTNDDGELSMAEAAAVEDIGNVFAFNSNINIFDEFQYFTGITSIGSGAFKDCQSLNSIIIPESVASISVSAFWGCQSLSSITIPTTVSSIGAFAFKDCSSLTSINIPNSVIVIDNRAIEGCSGVESIKVDNGNIVYDSRDNCNAVIETKTNTLIAGCMNTIIPNSVTSIGSYAFWGCQSLTSIIIPNTLTCIAEEAFFYCKGLTSVTIPNSVTSIGKRAFGFCQNLISVTISNSVTSIGEEVFLYCTGLKEVHSLIESPFAINASVFDNVSLNDVTLYVP